MNQQDAARVIGGFVAENRVWLAPMAGWTDAVYRVICRQMGAGLACTEMVSAQGLAYNDGRTADYLEVSDAEGCAVVQLFGSDPAVIASQAARVQQMLGPKLAAIDINMGCPARKVAGKGEGSALMKTPQLAARIIAQTAAAIDVPLTVKIRRGYEKGNDVAVEFAQMCESEGAAAVTVHGRFARELYHGQASWECIARVKEALRIPVLASGDLFTPQAIVDCLQQTGADAAMVARGAQGNPWIFAHTAQLMQSRAQGDASWTPAQVTLEERLRVMRLHVRGLAQRDPRAVVHMRTYFAPYFKGIPGASRYRGMVVACSTLDDFERFFDLIMNDALDHGYAPGDTVGWDDRNGRPGSGGSGDPIDSRNASVACGLDDDPGAPRSSQDSRGFDGSRSPHGLLNLCEQAGE